MIGDGLTYVEPASAAGYRQVEHTADIALELWGPDEEALLEQGALALVELLTDGAAVPATADRQVEVEVVDDGDRLVRWLNEVIWLALVDGFVVASARFDLSDPGRLRAHVLGDSATAIVTEIKSATYHGLQIEREGPRLRARVVLDV
jgi:SHS2 domain-containing protein